MRIYQFYKTCRTSDSFSRKTLTMYGIPATATVQLRVGLLGLAAYLKQPTEPIA